MITQIIQTTLTDLKDASRQHFDESTSTWEHAWQEHGGDKYVAQYSTGQACIWGPFSGNKFEVQAENQETLDFITSLSVSSNSIKDEARSNGLTRAFIRTSNRELIKNSRGQVVGYMPAFGMVDPRSAFFGDEDIEEAPEITGLE